MGILRKDKVYGTSRLARTSLKARVERRLNELGITAAEATRRGGLSRTLIYEILQGSARNVRTDTAQKLANALDADLAYITGDQDEARRPPSGGALHPVAFAQFLGDIAAGVWHEFHQLHGGDVKDGRGMGVSMRVPAAPVSDYPVVQQYAVKVVGTSVNRIIPDGSYAYFRLYEDLRTSPASGDLVVVERERGGLYEYTIKRVKATQRGLELHPDSDDPKYQEPLSLTGDLMHPEGAPEITVRIRGKVFWMGAPV